MGQEKSKGDENFPHAKILIDSIGFDNVLNLRIYFSELKNYGVIMANETSAKSPSQTLDETLNKTELGHLINENKNAILAAIGIALTLIVIFSVYRHLSNEKKADLLNQSYAFQTSVLEPYFQGEMDAAQAAQRLQNMDKDLVGNVNLAAGVFQAVDKLAADAENEAAIAVLESWYERLRSDSFVSLVAGLKLAPLYENAGQADKAIATYESLLKNNRELLESRIYFELGR